MKTTNKLMIGVLAGAGGVLALLGAIGLTVAYTGGYNVAATEQHGAFVRWAFDTTFRNSVERRAAEIPATVSFTPEMIEDGAERYKQMCQHCHAGPGVERAEWVNGMRPVPPHLAEAAEEREPREVFWLVKHGVKMSGMPSFGQSHDDPAIWNLTAFVGELPAMTPERYAAFGKSSSSHDSGAAPSH
ncbi:c-type cytochrome [Aurantimonas coralicida]|uniref:c-type cytochrome n=1 Tax=Aurantimonas coralicida TaxID=182270 RepID=UPI00165D7D88|nr:cytochrome c [Aurantimonas coralicida]MCC4299065.1 cytochrome c [Aurantimonas coralicida]